MIEKPKTLKDIDSTWQRYGKLASFRVEGLKKELKKEAIKEIKDARDSKNGTKGLFGGGVDFMFTKDVIGYIKWKFNVEEEDLK